MDTDKLWKLLDSVQAQIRVFDTKAQIVIAIDGVLAGYFGTQITRMAELIGQQPGSILHTFLGVFDALCIVLLLSSLLLAITTVHPRLHLEQPNSRLFFVHISQEFKRDYTRAGKVLTSLTVDELDADLASQILVNSIICCTKAKRFKHALYAMSSALVIWILVLYIQLITGITTVSQLSPAQTKENLGSTTQNVYFCGPDESSRTSNSNRKLAFPQPK
jgi:hypothetical protein